MFDVKEADILSRLQYLRIEQFCLHRIQAEVVGLVKQIAFLHTSGTLHIVL